MRRRGAVHGFVGVAVAAACLAAAGPAAATLKVSSNNGLLLEDKNGTFNDRVQLSLVTSGVQLQWRVFKDIGCGPGCLDLVRFELGPGCQSTGDASVVLCSRTGTGVTVLLKGGDDQFSPGPKGPAITDPITVNGSTGNDLLFTAGGDDTVQGGSGNDILDLGAGADRGDGSTGDDTLRGGAAADTLNGGDGADEVTPDVGADVVDAGAGNDTVRLGTVDEDERDEVQGGLGSDRATYTTGTTFGRLAPVRIIEGNLETVAGDKDFSEGDVLRSVEIYGGGRGDDILTGVLSSNAGDWFGEGGNDTLFGSTGNNTLTGGAGDDQLTAKDGNDIIDAKSGEASTAAHTDAVIDCGPGSAHLAILDLLDDSTPTACEAVDRSPLGEGPHVRPSIPRLARVADGAVGVALACPRSLRRSCAGTLRLRLGSAATARTAYSIRPGRTRRVAVRLGALGRRVGRRTEARLISVEAGLRGRKTTERRILLAR